MVQGDSVLAYWFNVKTRSSLLGLMHSCEACTFTPFLDLIHGEWPREKSYSMWLL